MKVSQDKRMHRKSSLIAAGLAVALFSGCASNRTQLTSPSTQTAVALNQGNYRVIQAGAIGKSYGFRLLGILPFASASVSKARADLYRHLGTPVLGKAVALANTTEDKSGIYLILFYIPVRTVQADVIEYLQPPAAATPPPPAPALTPAR
jgi:hypothetical protein